MKKLHLITRISIHTPVEDNQATLQPSNEIAEPEAALCLLFLGGHDVFRSAENGTYKVVAVSFASQP
jgi:hypothetical protein